MSVWKLVGCSWPALLLVAFFGNSLFAANPITIESLLKKMVDRDNVAHYPTKDFRLKQASSYDRKSKTPEVPKGWFANFDRSTSDKHPDGEGVRKRHCRKQ